MEKDPNCAKNLILHTTGFCIADIPAPSAAQEVTYLDKTPANLQKTLRFGTIQPWTAL